MIVLRIFPTVERGRSGRTSTWTASCLTMSDTGPGGVRLVARVRAGTAGVTVDSLFPGGPGKTVISPRAAQTSTIWIMSTRPTRSLELRV